MTQIITLDGSEFHCSNLSVEQALDQGLRVGALIAPLGDGLGKEQLQFIQTMMNSNAKTKEEIEEAAKSVDPAEIFAMALKILMNGLTKIDRKELMSFIKDVVLPNTRRDGKGNLNMDTAFSSPQDVLKLFLFFCKVNFATFFKGSALFANMLKGEAKTTEAT